DQKSMFAEDMTYAFKLLNNGGKLAYVAEAVVFHSHDLTLKENYKRSRALGENQAQHPEIYQNLSSEKEGMKYVRYVVKRLSERGRILKIPYFLLSCAVRYLGVLNGRRSVKK
ncbi:MAG: glycosyltransferase family 2 protein, partial [Lachnospiraceae bacterium]|nr:glycosyltransferase family 2 protein [Lachnospiraceae bacterium]